MTFFNRLKLSPVKAGLLLLILNLATDIPLALYFDAWPRLAKEPDAWLNDFVISPLILGYLIWLQAAGKKLFDELGDRKIIRSKRHLQDMVAKCYRRLQSPWLSWIAALLALAFAVYFFVQFGIIRTYDSWVTWHMAIVWIRTPFMFLVAYAFTIMIGNLYIFITTLSEIFHEQQIQVEPYQPDQAGGIGSIGRFSANLGYLIALFGLTLSLNIIAQPPSWFVVPRDFILALSILLYVILAPAIFFLPIRAAHVAMVAYRNGLLKDLSKTYDDTLAQLRHLRSGGPEQVEPILKRVKQLDEERALISQFPVWPFNFENIRKFASLVISPLLPGVISIIVDWLRP